MTYTIAILYLCVARILLFSCRVVYKNPAVQQAFSGLSLCLIKMKTEESENTKNIIYSYLGRESNQKSII
nr:MAG TPA: hypothetical protein [Caudoviricetes sp.]